MSEPGGRVRIDDHERLLTVLDSAWAHGRGRVVVLDGEPGIGKTTLLDQLRRSASDHFVVLSGSVDRAGVGRPFGPLLDAFTEAAASAPAEIAAAFGKLRPAAVDALAPELRDRRSPLQQVPDERVRLVDGLAALLLAWSDHAPLLLVGDDAQMIDV